MPGIDEEAAFAGDRHAADVRARRFRGEFARARPRSRARPSNSSFVGRPFGAGLLYLSRALTRFAGALPIVFARPTSTKTSAESAPIVHGKNRQSSDTSISSRRPSRGSRPRTSQPVK